MVRPSDPVLIDGCEDKQSGRTIRFVQGALSWGMLLLILLGSAARDATAANPGWRAGAPKMFIEKPRQDIGEITDGVKAPIEFPIRNEGDADLIIRDVKSDCGCTIVDAPQEEQVVRPGESWTLKVTFDSTGRSTAKPLSKTIHFKTNDPAHPTGEVGFDVLVKSWYRLSPPGPLTLLAVRRGDESRKGLDIFRGSLDKPLVIQSVDVPAELPVSARAEDVSQSNIEQHRIVFKAKDDAPLGAFTGMITIHIEVGGKKEDLKIPLSGNIVGDIDYRPTQINLASQRQLRGKKLAAITLNSTTRRPFKIVSIEPSAVLDFDVRPGARNDGSEYTVQPQIRADAPIGPFGVQIVITTDSIDQPVVTIPVFGLVVAPLEMDPPVVRLRADHTTMGETRQVRLLSNTGGSALTIRSVTTDAKWLGAQRVQEPGEDVPHIELIQIYLISPPPQGVTTATVTVGTSQPGLEEFTIPVQILRVDDAPKASGT